MHCLSRELPDVTDIIKTFFGKPSFTLDDVTLNARNLQLVLRLTASFHSTLQELHFFNVRFKNQDGSVVPLFHIIESDTYRITNWLAKFTKLTHLSISDCGLSVEQDLRILRAAPSRLQELDLSFNYLAVMSDEQFNNFCTQLERLSLLKLYLHSRNEPYIWSEQRRTKLVELGIPKLFNCVYLVK